MNYYNSGYAQPNQQVPQQTQPPQNQGNTGYHEGMLSGVSSNEEPYESPAQYYLDWRAKTNQFQFWDKATQSNKYLGLPYSVQILDYRYCLKGFNKHFNTGVYSNEIKNFNEPLLLKRHPLKKIGENDAQPLAIITDYKSQESKIKGFQANLYLVIYVIDQYDMRNALFFQGKKALKLVENYVQQNRPQDEGVTLQSTSVDNQYGRLFYVDFVPNPQFKCQNRIYAPELEFLNKSYNDYKLKINIEIDGLRVSFNDDMTPKQLAYQNAPQNQSNFGQNQGQPQTHQNNNPFGTQQLTHQNLPQNQGNFGQNQVPQNFNQNLVQNQGQQPTHQNLPQNQGNFSQNQVPQVDTQRIKISELPQNQLNTSNNPYQTNLPVPQEEQKPKNPFV